MEKAVDTITSVFPITIIDKRPAVCLSGKDTIIWNEPFGLGWRFGIAYYPWAWCRNIHFFLDHTTRANLTEQEAVVTVLLKDSTDNAEGVKKRETTIIHFGHGPPAHLGSWCEWHLVMHPYVSLTVTTKAQLPARATTLLPSASRALRQSLESGDFIDTKFYVFSAKRSGSTAGKPRVVFANSNSIRFALPRSTLRGKQINNGVAPAFLVSMTGDNHINEDSILHEYEYEQDSDLDDDEDDEDRSDDSNEDTAALQCHTVLNRVRAGSSSMVHTPMCSTHGDVEVEFPAEPPAYSVGNCRMILVKGVAYQTWLAYIYFCYTGQISFRPLKSAQGLPSRTASGDTVMPPSCSPKSMYRLAASIGDERLKDIAYCAIKEGLSKDNIFEEAFSWFAAQHATILEYEVKKMSEFWKLPEVSSALKLQMKAVSLGKKPWAQHILIAIMDKLNMCGPLI